MKKKKVLMAASVASMIDQFNMTNIRLLLELGYEVHVACNCKERCGNGLCHITNGAARGTYGLLAQAFRRSGSFWN